MITIGVDIEQFVADPYGSGIQRVLQYVAREWPADLASVLFVIPRAPSPIDFLNHDSQVFAFINRW